MNTTIEFPCPTLLLKGTRWRCATS